MESVLYCLGLGNDLPELVGTQAVDLPGAFI